MWYLILAFLLGLGNPNDKLPDNDMIQTTDDGGGDEGETGDIIPPRPPWPPKKKGN